MNHGDAAVVPTGFAARLPATVEYLARLRAVAFDRPAGLVAHHHLRYLGDLSGGQIKYRACLDAAPWSPEEQDRVIEQVSLAFTLNAGMFEDPDAK